MARRLRVVNITTWSGAAGFAWFALLRLLDPAPEMPTRGFASMAVAIALALVPLLHRSNSLAAPLALIALAYVFLFVHMPVQAFDWRAMVNQLLRSYERTIAPAAE